MISHKMTTLNPLMKDNKMTQKLVVAGDYNKLWDDVAAVETAQSNAIPGGPYVANMGALSPLAIQTNGGATAVITLVSLGVYDSVISLGQILLGVSSTSKEITYGMVKTGGPAPTLVANPFSIVLHFDDSELGTQIVDVYVFDGVNTLITAVPVLVADLNGVII
jgi:hypothetical protein